MWLFADLRGCRAAAEVELSEREGEVTRRALAPAYLCPRAV